MSSAALSFIDPAVIFAAVLVLVVIAVLVSFRLFSVGVRRMVVAAKRLARGDLSVRVEAYGPMHLTELADALNQMARQLGDRLSTVIQHRNELSAVLASMAEGVLAIDLDERVISLNRAANDLLGVDADQIIGRSIQESVRNTTLQALIRQTLERAAPVQGETTLRSPKQSGLPDRYLQVQTAPLRDADGQRLGVLVVLHDVTQLRRLESVRRDFVANVSHEVKTPVSAIKAAVETMLDDSAMPRDQAERFMGIIKRQADRLDAIVEDLLVLARLESQEGDLLAEIEAQPVKRIIEAAAETCQAKASEKNITIRIEAEGQPRALANAMLLEQALVNLIDNAIKYSPADTEVGVQTQRRGDELIIAVTDQGRGIEPQHIERIFERFYRTDRARSRELGGTGLGLSIVKHVADTHGGRVSVDSEPGLGSTFRIHIVPVDTRATTTTDPPEPDLQQPQTH